MSFWMFRDLSYHTLKEKAMKKKLKFVISFVLILVIIAGSGVMPASSYEHDVPVSSGAMLLYNLDTNTVCYQKNVNKKWYASYLSELMTFIVALQNVANPEREKIYISPEFIKTLSITDGCLDKFIGETLTLKDLLTIMMMTTGNDAAHLIAYHVSDGSVTKFVELMNRKATELGCVSTHFVSPGMSGSLKQVTTCKDLSRIFMAISTLPLYSEIMASATFTPEGYDESDYQITTETSILNPNSPYYFRYAQGGKYSYARSVGSNIVVTTTYRGKSYLFIALKGMNTSEKNVFADARRLTTWAYLNLSDRKVIDADKVISDFTAVANWGEYKAPLYASDSAYKTLPVEYEEEKFAYKIFIPDKVVLPVFDGQTIGSAKIYYDGNKIDDVNLISNGSQGISLLGDLARFSYGAFSEILSEEPPTEPVSEEPTEAPTEAPTQAPTKAKKSSTANNSTAPTESAAITEG